MNDFDIYTLWIFEQQRQHARSKYITMYAQFRQLQANQPRRSMWFVLATCLQALKRKFRALPTRLALPRPLTQDTPLAVQNPVPLTPAQTPPGHRTARREKHSVAAGP